MNVYAMKTRELGIGNLRAPTLGLRPVGSSDLPAKGTLRPAAACSRLLEFPVDQKDEIPLADLAKSR